MRTEIVLEELALDHAHDIYDLTNANRQYLMKWLPWLDQINAKDDTKKFIETAIEESSSGDARKFAILYYGAVCGVVGLQQIDKQHRTAAMGYWLAENFTGKGIMTDAVTQVLRVGFDELGLHRIEIRCAVENIKSRAIPERLGFINEAILRQCEWLYSRYVDHFVYSILEYEFNVEGAGNVTPGTGTSHHSL